MFGAVEVIRGTATVDVDESFSDLDEPLARDDHAGLVASTTG